MKNEIFTACYQLIAAAVNGTYQGILITVLVAASLRSLRRTNAATRYAVWFWTLVLLALIIPAHCVRSRWDADKSLATVEAATSAPASESDSDVMRMEASSLPPDFKSESDYLAPDGKSPGNKREFDAGYKKEQQYVDLASGAETHSQLLQDPARAIVLAPIEASGPNQVEPTPEVGFFSSVRQKLNWLSERAVTPLPSWKITPKTPVFVAALLPVIWLTVAGAKASLLIWQLFRIRRLKLNSTDPRPELNSVFLSLCKNVGVRRNVILRVSSEQRSPVVLGFLKPVILLPADGGLDASEHVLRHELAHVRRRDDWANLVQHCIKAIFFFHPAIWWVSKRISLEREIACDDQVLQSSLRPRAYALLLADLAGRMQPSVLAPGVSTNQSQLKQRIDMILNSNRNTSPRLAKERLGLLATAALLMTAAAIYSAPRLAFAQTEAAPSASALPPDAPSAPVASAGPSAELAVSQDAAPSVSWAPSPAAPGTASVGAGPKFKPGSTISVDIRPAIAPQPSIAILTAPSPDVAPVPSVMALTPPAPVPPMIASAETSPQPDQPLASRPPHRPGRDSSLEERLDRLEKMVESLAAQKDRPGQFNFSPKTPPGDMKFNWESFPDGAKQWEKAQADFAKKQAEFARKQAEFESKRGDMEKHLAELRELEKPQNWNDSKAGEKIKELAEQHAKMAVDQAKVAEQAAREAERAARDAQRGRTIHKMSQDSRQQLDALHKQHEMLQKRMEELDRQIEKLERDQEQFEERRGKERDVDVQEDQNNSNSNQHAEPSNDALPSRQPAAK